MPRGPQGQKRPADTVSNTIRVAMILTGEIEEDTGDPGKDKPLNRWARGQSCAAG
jgi:hypothetical protein